MKKDQATLLISLCHTLHTVYSGNSLLTVPRTRLKTYGEKAFAKAAPQL